MKWNDQSKWYSAANPLQQIQIATWNDYEEGTTIESGIDNCVTVNAVMSGASVTWSLSGAGLENTIDHYTVFISADGQNLMPLVDVPTGTYSVDLDPYKFLKGNYAVYVKAVGKPALTNKMSNATYYAATFVPNKPPVAALSLSASSAYTPSTVTANASGSSDPDGTIASTLIEWGDGTSASGAVVSHVYKTAGAYTVRAIVTDNSGATSATTSNVSVQPAVVRINAPATASTSGMIVHVDSTALNGNPVDGMWAYVDGIGVYSTKGGSLIADLKMNPGTHTLKVKAWDIYGGITQGSVQVNVVNQSPVAAMSLSASSAPTGTAITASNTGSYDPDGAITSTIIDFGDGFTAAAASASHAYTKAGTYTVKVMVTDAAGGSASTSSQVVIANRAPIAKINLSASSLWLGTALSVDSSGSSDPDGAIVATQISFGDGTSVSGTSAARTYLSAGTYTVMVTVTDNNGASSSASATVLVTAAGVKITKPAQNSSSTTTSVNVAASAAAPRGIASMMIYVDGMKKYTIYASSLNTSINIPKGTHTVQVKAWENTVGTIYQSSVVTTVK
jgi:PKD repeat protein